MIPRNCTQCHPKTLGFSALISLPTSSFNLTRASISRVSVNASTSSCGSVIVKLNDRSFLIKAESNSEGGVELNDNVEESEYVDSEALESEAVHESEAKVGGEVHVEEKPPRKPQIKRGDIMGILNRRAIEASEKERPVPDIRTGDVVEIKLEVPEKYA